MGGIPSQVGTVGIQHMNRLGECASSGSKIDKLLLECEARGSDGSEAVADIQTTKDRRKQIDAYISYSINAQKKRSQSGAAPEALRDLFNRSII
jgi:hypothetical protein